MGSDTTAADNNDVGSSKLRETFIGEENTVPGKLFKNQVLMRLG
jgi:hypothetical protein